MVELDRPLPAELLRRNTRGLVAYSLYPAFSWTWLRKRSLLVVIGCGTFGLLLLIGGIAARRDFARYWPVPLEFMLGALSLSSLGPLLATLVRRAGWSPAKERHGVVASIVLGALLNFGVDDMISSVLEVGIADGPKTRPDELMLSPGWQVFNVLVLLATYTLVGGGLALRRYLAEERGLIELTRERELATLRAEKHALDMRLGMLQAQIEPHFLLNTLASVRSLINTDPVLAATTIELLVDYLRATIPRLREAALESTLGQQLEICESYLRLMCVRISRLQYRIEVAPALRLRPFPSLLLITLVENAIKHGIEPKVGPGSVVISAQELGGRLQVDVVDDGMGLREAGGGGLGLRNVREQLQARHGGAASFTLSSPTSGGARATIEAP